MSRTVFQVEGMSCMHCKRAVEEALKELAGVDDARVDLEKKEVVIEGSADRSSMVSVVEDAGYEVKE